jgi:hypothetical protein
MQQADQAEQASPTEYNDEDLDGLFRRPFSGDILDLKMSLAGHVGGLCPVQGEGLLDSKPWYFRSRHEHWTFTMAQAGGDVHAVRSMFHSAALEDGWNIERDWPFGTFSAGYMPLKSAFAIIRACARLYWAGKLPEVKADLVKYAEEEKALDEWSAGIRASSYCDCSHNQPEHGIGNEPIQVIAPEEFVADPYTHKPRACTLCGCLDFHYSAEQSRGHRASGEGDHIDDEWPVEEVDAEGQKE